MVEHPQRVSGIRKTEQQTELWCNNHLLGPRSSNRENAYQQKQIIQSVSETNIPVSKQCVKA